MSLIPACVRADASGNAPARGPCSYIRMTIPKKAEMIRIARRVAADGPAAVRRRCSSVYTTAVASISTRMSGWNRVATPSNVDAG